MKYLLALFSGLLIAATPMAQDASAPDVLIKTVTNEVLEIVRKDKDIQSGNTRKAIELVEAKVLPHFNFMRMTQLSLARDWRQASAQHLRVVAVDWVKRLLFDAPAPGNHQSSARGCGEIIDFVSNAPPSRSRPLDCCDGGAISFGV